MLYQKMLGRNALQMLKRLNNRMLAMILLAVFTVLVIFYTLPLVQSNINYENDSMGSVQNTAAAAAAAADNKANGDYIKSENHKVNPNVHYAYIQEIFKLIQQHSPPESAHKVYTDRELASCKLKDLALWDAQETALTKEALEGCIPDLGDRFYLNLKTLHQSFLQSLKSVESPQAPVEEQGIVLIAGDVYTVFALGVIRSIKLNSEIANLPIQIIFPDYSEDNKHFCENIIDKVFPASKSSDGEKSKNKNVSKEKGKSKRNLFSSSISKDNGISCDFMSDVLTVDQMTHLKKYQYKPMALLMSKFKKTLYLDSDAYISSSINHWFTSEIFEETGLIMWPDFWRRLHHPKLYEMLEINQKEINAKNRTRVGTIDFLPQNILDHMTTTTEFKDRDHIPFHDYEGTIPDLSTESGILLYDKSKHLLTLALSMYYNFNGPHLYYTLLNQNLAGEGDKDTFILAATVLNQPYYQVRGPPQAHGYWCDSDEVSVMELPEFNKDNEDENMDLTKKWKFRGTTIMQRDFAHDYKLQKWLKKQYLVNLQHEKLKYCKAHNIPANDCNEDNDDDDDDVDDDTGKSNSKLEKFYQLKADSFDIDHYVELYKAQTEFPVFHVNLPKFDPYGYAKEQDGMYQGKKFQKQEKGIAHEQLKDKQGHFRLLGTDVMELVGKYDIELSVFKMYKDVFCSHGKHKNEADVKAINDIQYLREKFNTKNSKKQDKTNNKEDEQELTMDDMCLYINERYTYLDSSTWEHSVY